MKKNLIYFVLYLLVLAELLLVINERDELLAKEKEIQQKLINEFVELYLTEPQIYLPQKKFEDNVIKGKRESATSIPFTVKGITEDERYGTKYFVKVAPNENDRLNFPSSWPEANDSVLQSDNFVEDMFYVDDSSKIMMNFMAHLPQGKYGFDIYCSVNRDVPSFLNEDLRAKLREKIQERGGTLGQKFSLPQRIYVNINRPGQVQFEGIID